MSLTNMTPEQIAERGKAMAQIEGLGLFYGAAGSGGRKRIFTESDWTACCKQAVSWGMHVVHPKVADGGYWWYDQNGLKMLKSVADAHGLKCYPYHYCYGDKFGALNVEASYTIEIGQFFGGVCPDMEIEFEQSSSGAAWATRYGELVRAKFQGPVIPTLFANPEQHGHFPYKEILAWASGWMPMAYFDLWTSSGHSMTAKEAVYFLYPQWVSLNKTLVGGAIFPPPILPLIELGNHLSSFEVTSWLQQMKNYGYCGFWYDGTFAPYALAVSSAPVPAWPKPAIPVASEPSPTTTPAAPAKPQPTGSVSTSATNTNNTTSTVVVSTTGTVTTPSQSPATPENSGLGTITGMQQTLTPDEYAASFAILDSSVPYDPKSGIGYVWTLLLTYGYAIGAPTCNLQTFEYNGIVYTYLPCEGGRIWMNQATGHVWVQPTSIARIPGTPQQQ